MKYKILNQTDSRIELFALYEDYYTYDNYEVGETFQYPVYYPQGMKEFM